jgi:hypothetical protein
MTNTSYKRLLLFEKGFTVFFLINFAIMVLCKNILLSVFPQDIRNYFFWLSMGLYIGFLVCKNEFKKLISASKKENYR